MTAPASSLPLTASPATLPAIVPSARESVRPTWAEIDLGALRHNLSLIRRMIPARTGVLAMVKADAYGHGLIPVARALLGAGVEALGVATADEALELRETAGFEEARIVLLAPSFPDDAQLLQDASIEVSVGSYELLLQHLRVAIGRGAPARLHLMLDTGLGRDGFRCEDLSFFEELAAIDHGVVGLCTHFAVADGVGPEERRYTWWQRERFETAVRTAYRSGLRPTYHAANSGAILNHPQSHFELVRPGLLLYGCQPAGGAAYDLDLKPVMQLKSRLAVIKTMLRDESVSYGRLWTLPTDRPIGIVALGYGDGLPLGLSNQGEVLVRGRRVPIRGRICMDQFMVDLAEVPEAQVGDEVVVYGSQGGEILSVTEAARRAGTIPYALTTSVTRRVPRRYVG